MVEQNLFLCLLLSAMAGIFTIAGKVVVLQLARRHKKSHQLQLDDVAKRSVQSDAITLDKQTARKTYWIMTCFVLANIVANFCIFIAPWFGPVSIYWPAYIASQLMANMLLVGTLLQQERFDKPAQVATLVVVAAVLFITVAGPGEPQTEQEDIKELILGNSIAIAWISTLCLVFFLSFLTMMSFFATQCSTGSRQEDKHSESSNNESTVGTCFSPQLLEIILLLVSTTCSALSATASKAASTLTSPQDSTLRSSLITISWIIIICWSVENYLEGRHVRSLGRFLPAVTLGSIVLNAITGMIVWKDAQVVVSWAGYATALCLLGMGVYLISDLDFFKAQIQEQQDYQRQIQTWQDLFAILEEDLTRAQVEQSLNRHQRIMSSDHLRLGGRLPRGNSDPELGTRSNGDEFFPPLSTVLSHGTCVAPSKSGSSVSSYPSITSVDMIASPPRLRLQRLSASTSATVRTLDSLERIGATIRNFQQEGGDKQPISPSRVTGSDIPTTCTELSFSNKTGPTFSTATSDISGHSRDSSIYSRSAAQENDDNGLFAMDDDILPSLPPSPFPSRTSPRRRLNPSPYRRNKEIPFTSTMSSNRHKSPRRRSYSLDNLGDFDDPSLQEVDEDGEEEIVNKGDGPSLIDITGNPFLVS